MPVAGGRGGGEHFMGPVSPCEWGRLEREVEMLANVLDALNGARQTLRRVPVCYVCSPTMQNTF